MQYFLYYYATPRTKSMHGYYGTDSYNIMDLYLDLKQYAGMLSLDAIPL
jgi:hypothetical protein